MSPTDKVRESLSDFVKSAGIPATEFDVDFVVKMMAAMMVSYFKYGEVAKAYPEKYDAISDIRVRITKYRETGNKHYLVDAANFAMIESMFPGHKTAQWGTNDSLDSPGRSSVAKRALVKQTNAGDRILDIEA